MMKEFQEQVAIWFRTCFGNPPDHNASNPRERAARFAEEAIETMQAAGLTKDEVASLVDYVFSRPKGDLMDEISGSLTTIAALATTHNLNLDECALHGISSLYSKMEKVRAKHRNKPPGSVIPGEYRG